MAYHNLNDKSIPLTAYPDVPIASPVKTPQVYASSYTQPVAQPSQLSPMYTPYSPSGAQTHSQPLDLDIRPQQPYTSLPSAEVYVPSTPSVPLTPLTYAELRTTIRARDVHFGCKRYIKQAHQFTSKNWCKLVAAFILWWLLGLGVSKTIDLLAGRHNYPEDQSAQEWTDCEQQKLQREWIVCEPDGSFRAIQSIGFQCHCVDYHGVSIDDTLEDCYTFTSDCALRRNYSACEAKRIQDTTACAGRGCFISQCDDKGDFLRSQKHSSTNACWCVDDRGREINGTRDSCLKPPDCSPPQVSWDKTIARHIRAANETFKELALWGVLHAFATVLLWTPALIGAYVAVFNAIKTNSSIVFRDFFAGFSCRYYCKLLCLSIVVRGAEVVLLLLLLIPGVWWVLVTMFAFPLHKEHQYLGIWGSIRLSIMVIHRHFCSIVGFLLLLALLQIGGLLFFLIGVLYTMPLAFVALCYCYNDLIGL